MTANELAGIVLALVLGAAALVPPVLRLLRDPRAWEMWIALGSFAALLALFLVLGLAADWGGGGAAPQEGAVTCTRGRIAYEPSGWDPGSPGPPCPQGFTPRYEYCETFATSFVKQPVNTWSALAFAAAGFWGLFFVRRRRAGPNDPMRAPTFFSVGMALTLVFVWWGTMALHASWRSWAGYLDAFSILVWLLFCIVYSLGRRVGLLPDASPARIGTFLLLFLAAAMPVGVITYLAPGVRLAFLVAFGAFLLALELAILVVQNAAKGRWPTVVRSWPWYLAVVGAFAAAFACKLLADFLPLESRWCWPDSPLQGHALWHVFAALTAFFAFVYYRDEVYTPRRTRG